MFRARVEQVSGLNVRAGGKWLTCIGNRPVKVGDTIWTDGRCVYGNYQTPQQPIVIISKPDLVIPIVFNQACYTYSSSLELNLEKWNFKTDAFFNNSHSTFATTTLDTNFDGQNFFALTCSKDSEFQTFFILKNNIVISSFKRPIADIFWAFIEDQNNWAFLEGSCSSIYRSPPFPVLVRDFSFHSPIITYSDSLGGWLCPPEYEFVIADICSQTDYVFNISFVSNLTEQIIFSGQYRIANIDGSSWSTPLFQANSSNGAANIHFPLHDGFYFTIDNIKPNPIWISATPQIASMSLFSPNDDLILSGNFLAATNFIVYPLNNGKFLVGVKARRLDSVFSILHYAGNHFISEYSGVNEFLFFNSKQFLSFSPVPLDFIYSGFYICQGGAIIEDLTNIPRFAPLDYIPDSSVELIDWRYMPPNSTLSIANQSFHSIKNFKFWWENIQSFLE